MTTLGPEPAEGGRPDDPWTIERYRGRASTFHARPLPEPFGRGVWAFEVDGPAVALGSTQAIAAVDAVRAQRAGVEVARRRSGGGAVWLAPGEVTWVDVLVPATDPLANHDVSRAALWLGEVWVRTLETLGVQRAAVHRGPMVRTAWSDLVCFAGGAPGEVTVDARKIVGISQRRTRAGARFQCALLHRWQPGPLLDVLALHDEERTRAEPQLADCAVGTEELNGKGLRSATVVQAFVDCLQGGSGPE